LGDLAPPSCVPELIALLSDDDGEVRFHTAAALNRLTGQTLGFSPDRCAADPRDPAPVAAWQEWWSRNRSRYPARS
jgi:HEAT repeat protein